MSSSQRYHPTILPTTLSNIECLSTLIILPCQSDNTDLSVPTCEILTEARLLQLAERGGADDLLQPGRGGGVLLRGGVARLPVLAAGGRGRSGEAGPLPDRPPGAAAGPGPALPSLLAAGPRPGQQYREYSGAPGGPHTPSDINCLFVLHWRYATKLF